MYEVDVEMLNNHIKEIGLKQTVIADKSGISEVKLSLILNGKRRCEAGEYVSICKSIGANVNRFVRPRMPSETKNC